MNTGLRTIDKYIDSHDCVVMKNGDGGDANHGFFYVIGAMYASASQKHRCMLRDFARRMIGYLQVDPETYVRHKDDGVTWHADPKEFSRDQELSLVWMMAVCGFNYHVEAIVKSRLRRFGRCQNADILGPEHWGLYIRAMRWRWLYLTLILCDLHMVLSVIVRCIKSQLDFDDVGDDKNTTLMIMAGESVMWTPLVEIARLIYKYFRADWFVDGEYHHKISIGNGVQYAWDRYYREETGAPPINDYMRPFITGWLAWDAKDSRPQK